MPGNATAIIPARLGSTRFPRKVLAADTGKPMVAHVCERAALAESIGRVVVATDSNEVAEAVHAHGFEAVMTSPNHTNGTSRLDEAARVLGLDALDVVVNVQGDEPEIEPGIVDAAVTALQTPSAPGLCIGTVASPMPNDDASNPNIVKVVLAPVDSETGVWRGAYFSRAPIPHDRDGTGEVRRFRHIGIYAYSANTLATYAALPESPLERAEKLEQLRAIESLWPIYVAVRDSHYTGIDTPEQYAAFVERWRTHDA